MYSQQECVVLVYRMSKTIQAYLRSFFSKIRRIVRRLTPNEIEQDIAAAHLRLLHETTKDYLHLQCALFRCANLPVLIIHIAAPKPRLVALSPLEVVHEGPGHISLDLATVFRNSLRQSCGVISEVLGTERIFQDLFLGKFVLSLDTGTVLSYVDVRVPIALAEPVDEIAEALGIWSQPEALGLIANALAALGVEETLQVAQDIVVGRRTSLMLDVVGGVVVHAVEVVGPLHERDLFVGEGGQTIPKLLYHGVRVFTEVNGVREPRDGEFDLAVSGLNVSGVLRVPGVCSISIERDADLALVCGLELVAVHFDSAAMRYKTVVSNDPLLTGAITNFGLRAI